MEWFERERNVSRGFLSGHDVTNYQCLTFDVGLFQFTSHRLAHETDWHMRFKHTMVGCRPRLSIAKNKMHGIQIMLPESPYVFHTWKSVFSYIDLILHHSTKRNKIDIREVRWDHKIPMQIIERIEFIEKIVEKPVPVVSEPQWRTETRYLNEERPFMDTLRMETDRIIETLGDYRKPEPVFDMSNVLKIENYLVDETDDIEDDYDPAIEEMIRKAAVNE